MIYFGFGGVFFLSCPRRLPLFLVINHVQPLQDMSFIPAVEGQLFKAQFLTLAGRYLENYEIQLFSINYRNSSCMAIQFTCLSQVKVTKVFLTLA